MNGRPRSGARRAVERPRERGGLGGEGLGVRGVGGGVRRVGRGERRGDGAGRRDRVRRGRARGGRRAAAACSCSSWSWSASLASSCASNGPPARTGSRATPGASSSVTQRRVGREGGDRVGEPGRERRADPDHEVGLLQQPRLGRPQRVAVRRGAGRQDQRRARRCPAITRAAIDCTGAMSAATRGAATAGGRQAASARAIVRRCSEHDEAPSGVALWPGCGATRIAARERYKVTMLRSSGGEPRRSGRTITADAAARRWPRSRRVCDARRLRLTPARACVLEALLESHRAMTAYELLERLEAAGLGSAPPVVYRALDFLVSNGFVHRIERLGAFAACAHAGQARHGAGFLVCRVCRAGRGDRAPAAARAGGRGRGGGLRDRAAGGRGRGALRPLPGGRGVSVLDRGAGPRRRLRRAARCSPTSTLTLQRRRDRHGGRAERLGQEHAAAAADRRRAAGPRAGDAGAGAADRLRAAEARGRPDAAADRRRAFSGSRAAGGRSAAEALEQVGIAGLGGRQLAALSGGQFQRAMLAQAVLRRPDLLVLDEATQGLDQAGEARFYRLIEQLRQRARLRRADGEPRPARGDGGLGPGDLPERPRLLRGDADRGLGRAGVSVAVRLRDAGGAGALPARPRPRAWPGLADGITHHHHDEGAG